MSNNSKNDKIIIYYREREIYLYINIYIYKDAYIYTQRDWHRLTKREFILFEI